MATHSSIPVWRIPWIEEPDGLQSIVSPRVKYDRSNLAHMHTDTKIYNKNKIVTKIKNIDKGSYIMAK